MKLFYGFWAWTAVKWGVCGRSLLMIFGMLKFISMKENRLVKETWCWSSCIITVRSHDSGEYETEFFVRGKSVCREAWLLAQNMNKETFRRILNKFKDGVLVLEHGNKGKSTVMPKTAECISWLQFFVNSIGDHQPNKGCIHLPSCFSRIDIYKKMMEENTALNLPTVSLSHFYNIWEKHFTHVLIPKVYIIYYYICKGSAAKESYQVVTIFRASCFIVLSISIMKSLWQKWYTVLNVKIYFWTVLMLF